MSVELAKQRILQRVPLHELVAEKVELKLKGGRYTGCCPFHDERSPSFFIFDDHYYCFGCHARGDAITFVREQQGLNFIETLRYLAEKYSVDAPELEKPQHDRLQRQTEANLYKICASASTFFEEYLAGPQGEKARAYLEGRGFQPEFIKEHRLGLSPHDQQGLVNHLLREGFAIKDMISASVANPSQFDNKGYDFFSQRLMIPIFDLYGRVIAFGGRSLGDEQPKYKNSRETPLFDKSQVLYGLNSSRDSIRKERRAIACEGYMDVLQLWQHGVGFAVACLGTAMTIHHLKRLGALTPRVYLIFDGDRAGRNATLRTVSLALEVPQTEFKVVVLPAEHDPDSFVRSFGAEALEGELDKAQNLLEFAIQTRIAETHELGIPDLIAKEFVPWLQTIPDAMKRNYLAHKISELTGIDAAQLERTIKQEMPKKPAGAQAKPVPETPLSEPVRPLRGPELEFFAHLYWTKPGEIDLDTVSQLLKSKLEIDELWQEFAAELIKTLRRQLAPSTQNKAHWTSSTAPEVLQVIGHFELHAAAYETETRQQQMVKLAQEIRRRSLRDTLARLKQNLLKATPDEQLEILTAVSKITKELSQRSEASPQS